MTALVEAREQSGALRDSAERVEQLLRSPAGGERRREWYARLEDAVLELSASLPEGTEDYDARKLLELMVALRRAIEADADGTDARGEVELATLRAQDVARRIGRRLEHEQLDDPRAAADLVLATLRGIAVGDLARLLGVSTKTVNAWRAGGPVTRNAERVVVLAQLVTYLRASLTPRGIVMWLDAPREQLDGHAPLELLDAGEPGMREALVSLARGARAQLAA